jgi:hypothetical protein
MRHYNLLYADGTWRLIFNDQFGTIWEFDPEIPPFTSKEMAETMVDALNKRNR